MKNCNSIFWALLSVVAVAAACRSVEPDYGRELPVGAPALLPLKDTDTRPDLRATWYERQELAEPLRRSIDWTRTDYARKFFPAAGITHERALRSLERFEDLLDASLSAEEFQRAVEREFDFYKSAGWDGRGGGVLFTGYYTPILQGRTEPDSRFRFPLYALPPDLEKGPDGAILGQRTAEGIRPYPTAARSKRARCSPGVASSSFGSPIHSTPTSPT